MRKSRIASYALLFWAIFWIPYYLIFILGNPPLDYFSLYEIGKTNIWLKFGMPLLAIAGEIALLVAIVFSITTLFQKPKRNEVTVLGLVLIAVVINLYQYGVMEKIVTT